MLKNIRMRNFKRFTDVDFELGKSVVLIGPNNSGKTTALQAFALWGIGIRQWQAKRHGKSSPEERPGVTINRKDIIEMPVPSANLLWRDLRVRTTERSNGTQSTQNIRIDVIVDGITDGKAWSCGLEFDYANEESFYCRPLRRVTDDGTLARMPVPEQAGHINIAFLPPMSGLAAIEPKWEPGRINVLIGEGQTAQVLRNLCFQIHEDSKDSWKELITRIDQLFGVLILPPQFEQARGEITMQYREHHGPTLDISSSGRGLQQTLLLLAHLYTHPQTVLLLDEPDAHLEVLRQRQIYQLLTQTADRLGSQLIAASHSEVVLNEAADRDIVIAFVGEPHRIDDRGSQLLKSLKEIGFDQYYLAEQTGWVLYLEGSTDLAILQAFADRLQHPAGKYLERPFVYYVGNQMSLACNHFYGIQEAKSDLVGIAILDRDEHETIGTGPLCQMRWRKRELENYLTHRDVLLAYANASLDPGNLFDAAEIPRRITAMNEAIDEISQALRTLRNIDPWSSEIKATDDFLDPVFRLYYQKVGLPDLLRKTDYYVLANLVPPDEIDPEVVEKLDAIVAVAEQAVKREKTEQI